MYRSLLLLLSSLFSIVQTSTSQNKSTPIKVALVQAELKWGDVDANLKDFEQRVEQCEDCDLIVFPELFTSGCEMKKKDPQEKKKSKDKVSFSSGKDHLILSWKNHRFSTFICYDLRFPEWSKNKNDYETAIYIANWPESRHADWEQLLQQRAKENKANVIAVNCAGKDPFGKTYRGGSCIINPSGEITIQYSDYKEDIAFGFIP